MTAELIATFICCFVIGFLSFWGGYYLTVAFGWFWYLLFLPVYKVIHFIKKKEELKWQLKEITEDNDYWQKENEELKKENASLKAYNEKLLTSEMNKQNELCDTLIKCKRLEKENEEAKEIIKDLLGCLYSVEYDYISDLEEAEQFLRKEQI